MSERRRVEPPMEIWRRHRSSHEASAAVGTRLHSLTGKRGRMLPRSAHWLRASVARQRQTRSEARREARAAGEGAPWCRLARDVALLLFSPVRVLTEQ